MESFELESHYIILKDLQVEVEIRPVNPFLKYKISTYRTYINEETAILEIPAFIEEQKYLMLDTIMSMDIPDEMKNIFI